MSYQVCGGAGSTVDGVTTMDICCSLKVLFTNEMDNWQSSSSGKVCDSSGDGLLKQLDSGGGRDPGHCWGRGLSGEWDEARSVFLKLFLSECRRGPGSC